MAESVPARDWGIRSLLDQLEAKYSSQGAQEYWESERARIEMRLVALEDRLSERYVEPTVQGLGGSGVVLRVLDQRLSNEPCALKFPRPVVVKAEMLSGLMQKEIAYLAKLRHRSLVRIHESATFPEIDPVTARYGASFFPFYIMDFITGASSLRYARDMKPSTHDFVRLVHDTADALNYLHQHSVAHLDVKPDNVLVSADGIPVITDLGTAKVVHADTGATIVACTLEYADPLLVKRLDKDPSDENRAKGTIPRDEIDLRWDLYSLGKTILAWLGFNIFTGEENWSSAQLAIYERKYLLLMAARLLRGEIPPWLEDRIGINRRFLMEVAYRDMQQVLSDIKKLSGEYSIVDTIPELNAYFPKTLQVARETPTTYTDRTEKLLAHQSVRRLATITQLGLVNQVYPTATHSRLEHSLGTFHNACRFVLSLYHDPYSPVFRQIVDAPDINAVLVCALLHDVGQFPLAHDLEEIDSSLFNHKQLGAAVLRGIRDTKRPGAKKIQLNAFDDLLKAWGTTPERVVEILNAKPDDEEAPAKDRLLHSIVDGPVDADKLDYLRRDSDRLGVPYGNAIDTERILRSLTVAVERKGAGTVCIGVHEKAKVAAEFVAIARYAMFSQAYWQHSVRAMKAMLARAAYRIIDSLELRGDKAKNAFRSAFESLVLSLPNSLYEGAPVQKALFESNWREDATRVAEAPRNLTPGESTLASTDAIVIAFLRSWLDETEATEAEILQDLLSRRLYKRVFVFSHERAPKEWKMLLDTWEKLGPKQRLFVYEQLEKGILQHVDKRLLAGPSTLTLDNSIADRMLKRVGARKPLLLMDVPGARPGADIPLYYIIESQRRTLRKDDRSIGDVHASDVWQHFGAQLQQVAGKVRVFCHPDYVDAIQAAVTREDFLRIYQKAIEK